MEKQLYTNWLNELKELYNSGGELDSIFPEWPFKKEEWIDYYNEKYTPLEALNNEFAE